MCSILANAEKRKNEAVDRENKAHEDKQKAAEEAYNLHSRMDEKEGQVKVSLTLCWAGIMHDMQRANYIMPF